MTKLGACALGLTLTLTLAWGCKKAEPNRAAGSAAPSAASVNSAPKAPPADAKTVAAFKGSNPETGSRAKVHGYVGSIKADAWPIVDKVGETMPFVFCKMVAPPAEVKVGAHVVIEGKVEDPAMLQECTLTAL